MSEQADALSFGPQWIRDLSNGTSVCVPPPSPGPKYKLAEFRYGKEEMLALFSQDFTPPDMGELAEFILTKTISDPLACIPMSEEEQRTSFGSLNSAAVLKMMGRGGQRGGRGMSRGGRGSGRGRGEGGFYRGYSVDESSNKDDTWQREAASRRLSWGENGRGTYSERSTSRESESSPRALELSAPPVRHKEPSRALSSGNWRSSESGEGDDGGGGGGGGWIVSGSQRSERWRGSGRGGWHSQGSREDYQGGGERYSDSWGRGRPERSNSDDLPEWSKSDNVFEPDLGSFDSSGAFCVAKDKKDLHDTGQKEQRNDKEPKEDWDKEINNEKSGSCEKENDKADQHHEEKVARKESLEKKDTKQEDSQGKTTDIQQQANVRQNKVTTKPTEKSLKPGASGEENAELKSKSDTDNEGNVKSSPATTNSHHDEIGAHLERVAESCIANLDVEDEERHERHQKSVDTTPSTVERSRSSPVEETKWFYRDPQGNEQGPFSNEEMVEWFHHGYFTMQLSIRRQCDVMYLPLGEVIKRWQRVPFLAGPAPPPITPHQVMSEQTMMMQQQLLQQHYQQLHKQAILQQIQQQQQQQQQQRHTAPNLHLNTTSVDSSGGRPLHSPHSLPVTTHSVAHGGAAEVIWGTEPESPKSPWSPVPNNSPVWEQQNRQKSPVPSAEEVKRLAEEKAKAEAEKREAEIAAMKQQEEEKRQQMIQKEEEERLKREALQRENELRLKKQKEEEEEMRKEKERRRQEIQKQLEAEKRKQEAARQKKEAQQEQKQKKESGEQKQQKQNGLREQQKQALLRLQQQQQEQQQQQREQEKQRQEEQRKEQLRQEQEKQQRLQEQRMEKQRQDEMNAQQMSQQKNIQSNSSSRWGSQNAATLSLSEIQEQEEKNRRAHEEKVRELEARQRQLQAAASHSWAEKQASLPSVKSLKSIQDEQARQQRTKQAKQTQRSQAQPATVPSSGAWANTNSSRGSWGAGNNNNIWSGLSDHTEPEEPDDNDETGFWADAVRTASSKTAKSQAPPPKTSQPKVSSSQPVANGKKPGKKESKEEESVRRIFQSTVTNDPFTEWCIEHLSGLTTSVDIPTFVTFLKEVESPYEIHDYVRDFFGESNQAKSFAKEFIERKKTAEKRIAITPKPSPNSSKPSAAAVPNVVARGGGGGNRVPTTPNTSETKETSQTTSSKNKKKKKQRMQKVDPRILGFSVNAAAERVNMGEIQSVDDAS